METAQILADDAEKQNELEARIFRDGNDILIKVGNTAVTRVVPTDDIKTAEGLLGWTYELTGKTWMSSDLLRRFLDVAREASGVKFRT